MLQKEYFPIHMRFYGFWYRRKETGSLLKQLNNPKNKDNVLRMEAIKKEADKIHNNVQAIELPNDTAKVENMQYDDFKPLYAGKNVLIIIPYIKTDTFIKTILEKEKENKITIITTKPCNYIGRQWYEDQAEIFDMSTFLTKENYNNFINYIIKTRNIAKIYCLNTEKIETQKGIDIICETYDEDETLYEIYKERYRKSKTWFGKIKRHLLGGKK